MANKLKSRRHKKRRVVSSKKRRQTKPSTKRYRKKTRITRKRRGGMKRTAPSTPIQEYNEQGPPVAPKKSRTRAVDDAVVGVNLFQGFPGNQGNQENINPNQNVAVGTPPQTPMQQGPQTPVFTPIQFQGPPQTPIQQENLFAQGQVTPQGNLNNALDQAYIEGITTPPTIVQPNDRTIVPFGYDNSHELITGNNYESDDEFTDDEFIYDDPPNIVEQGYLTQEESDEE